MRPGPLVVLIGAPGSGKTTWASTWFEPDEVVCLDDFRRAVSGDPGNQEATEYAVKAANAIVAGRMRFGLPTVVDATNTDTQVRHQLVSFRFEYPHTRRARTVAVIFDTPLDECLARNARRVRSRRVPDEVIRKYHAEIERDYPIATTWIPSPFDTGIRIRPDGTYRMGGMSVGMNVLPWRDVPWFAHAKNLFECPDWDRPATIAAFG